MDSPPTQRLLPNISAVAPSRQFIVSGLFGKEPEELDGFNIPRLGRVLLLAFYNDTYAHALPAALNVVGSSLYRHHTERNVSIGVENAPFGLAIGGSSSGSASQNLYHRAGNWSDGVVLQLTASAEMPLFVAVFLVLAAFAASDVARDQRAGVRPLLRLSRVGYSDYWMAFVLVHVAQYVLPLAMFMYSLMCKWGVPTGDVKIWKGGRGQLVLSYW